MFISSYFLPNLFENLGKGGALASQLRGGGLRAQLLRGGLGSIGIKVLALGLSLLIAVILARALGPAGFGVYSFTFTVMAFLAIPAQFGLPNLVVRETARAQSRNDWPLIRGVWQWSFRLVVATSLGLMATGALVLWSFHGNLDLSGESLSTFAWGLLLIPLMGLAALRGAQLRGLRHVLSGQAPEMLVRPIAFLILLGMLWWLWPVVPVSAASAMAFTVGALAVAFLVGSVLVARLRPSALRIRGAVSLQRRYWLASTLPLAMTEGVSLINHHADILMLGVLASAEEVGIYRVVVHGATLVAFGLAAVNMVIAPHFARLHARGEHEKLQRLATRSAQAVLVIAVPMVLLFLLLGEPLIGWIFGEDYVPGYWPLVILCVGQLINALVGSVGVLLNMTGHEREVTVAVGIGALINVLLNLGLIPWLGMLGAAIASAVSLAIWNLMLWRVVRLRLGVDSSALGRGGA